MQGLKAAAEFIRAGKLGEVTFARTIIYGRRGAIGAPGRYDVPSHVDFNLWLGPGTEETLTRPRLHYDWHWVWDTGSGELGNNNIHMIDICRWLMNLDGLGDSVTSIGGRLGYSDAGETPNTQMVVHRFGPATIIQEVRGLKTDPFSEKFKSGYVIHGTEGFIAEGSLFDPDGNLIEKFSGPGENHFANFIRAVRSGRSEDLSAEIEEGHVSSGLCHVGNISHRLGERLAVQAIRERLAPQDMHPEVQRTFSRMVEHLRENDVDLNQDRLTLGPLLALEPGTESFTANDEANLLLGREYRAPFIVPAENEI